ncbi:hypothetical protein [Halomarina rubra]|uniref:Polysaccharide lyase-like protein n=1 Tax=Halomarina rubra TaxID=2071873 RepID=A0ABD6B264_9EURY|nr:hypothetical protein [Halomarina rubra]
MPIFDGSETPKRPLYDKQDGNGEQAATAMYVNDQDGQGERLVWTASDGALIASFENAEFDDAWHGRKDTVDGDLVTTTARAVDGTTSLRHPADGSYDATQSSPGDGLAQYIGVPSKQRFYVYFDDWSAVDCYWFFCRRNSGNDALSLRFWGTNNSMFFNEYVDGDLQTIARSNSPSPPDDQWLEITITVNDDTGTYAGLQDFEPMIEVYQVDSSFNRTTEVTTFYGDDGAGDPIAISQSNALNPGEGGYRWSFQGNAIVDVDYHHTVDN